MNQLTKKNKTVLGAVSIAALSLYTIRKYMSGGQCNIVKDLSGQVAIVTGGNSGIGREIAKILAGMKCKVIIGARDESRNKETI